MCDLCYHNPCLSNCPNAEPEKVYTCDRCGGAIYNGDPFFQINGLPDIKTLIICEDCINETKEFAEYEPYEPDECDVYKARVERDMCRDN